MRYGAMNFPINPVLAEIETIATLGFDFLELTLDPPKAHYSMVLRQKKEILAALKDRQMGLVCHLPTFVLPADLTDSLRQASRDEMLRSLETARELGAEKAVMHPSRISGLGPLVMDLAMGYAEEFLHIVVGKAMDLGICLCLENMFPRYGSHVEPHQFNDTLRRYPHLKLTLDTGHANIESPGSQRIFSLLAAFAPCIGHVHMSDNLGVRDDHLPLGAGNINFGAVVQALQNVGYDDTITLEIFVDDRRDLQKSLYRLKAMLETH